jgi:hypothetical protein
MGQRPVPDKAQHSQEKYIHVPGGIRTLNPSMRAAADLQLRPRDQWNRLLYPVIWLIRQADSQWPVNLEKESNALFPSQKSVQNRRPEDCKKAEPGFAA